jgi:hypothetical protein
MKKPGETLRANFGQEPFAFDIDRMMRDEKAAIQYLAHDGYVETAREFSDEIIDEARALANEDDADAPYREAKTDLDALNRQSKAPQCSSVSSHSLTNQTSGNQS